MDTVLSVLSSVFWGLLMLSVLVFLHEGGHFLAARACGVRVTEFFLAFRAASTFIIRRVASVPSLA